MDGPKGYDNCGWAPPRKGAVEIYCARRRGFVRGDLCPCPYWIRRLRIDRLKGKKKR